MAAFVNAAGVEQFTAIGLHLALPPETTILPSHEILRSPGPKGRGNGVLCTLESHSDPPTLDLTLLYICCKDSSG